MPARIFNKIREAQEDGVNKKFWLTPPMLGIYGTLLIHFAGWLWFMATLNVRVSIVEKRQDVQDKVIATLPVDFIPRSELRQQERDRNRAEEARDKREDRLESKIDIIMGTLATTHR